MDTIANLNKALNILSKYESFGVKYNLANIKKLLWLLNSPHLHFKTIHVVGSKGKGTTATLIAHSLSKHYRVGLYTSPHITGIHERFCIDGKFASFKEILQIFEEVEKAANKMTPNFPSFFEFVTASVFKFFSLNNVEVAVIEAGLGGRLDATNVTEPEIVVITSVELEHTSILGNTVEEIMFEKASVIPFGGVVVTTKANAANPSLLKLVHERSAKLIIAKEPEKNLSSDYIDHKIINLPLVEEVCNIMNCTPSLNVEIPARLQKINNSIIDCSHTPNSIAVFFKYLEKNLIPEALVISLLRDKNISNILKQISVFLTSHPQVKLWVTSSNHPRAISSNKLQNLIKAEFSIEANCVELDDIIKAVKNNKKIAVTGSIYTASEIIKGCYGFLKKLW